MATTPVFQMTPPWTPELLPDVQRHIENFLSTRSRPNVLELGSGWSTIWFASMPNVYVESYEDNEEWWDMVYKSGQKAGQSYSFHVKLTSAELMVDRVSAERDRRYDLVLVDCVDEARLPCLFASLTKVKDDGWIVVDDSHWEMFTEIPAIMSKMGHNSRTFSGNHTRKTGEVMFHQTTIFSKGPV